MYRPPDGQWGMFRNGSGPTGRSMLRNGSVWRPGSHLPPLLAALPLQPGEQAEEDVADVAVHFAYVAVVLGCVSSLICLLTLVAILHTKRPMRPNLQFVFSLLCSDLLTSTSVISKLSYEVDRSDEPSPCATIFMDGLRMTAHIAAFFNLCLIAVDMYVAILHPLRYSAIIDTRLVKILIFVSWSLAFLLGFSALYVPSTSFSSESNVNISKGVLNVLLERRKMWRNESNPQFAANFYDTPVLPPRPAQQSDLTVFCSSVFAKEYDSLFATLAVLILSAIVMVSIYGKIFCTIKRIHKTDDETAKNYGSKQPKHAKRRWSERLLTRIKGDRQCASASSSGCQMSSEASKTRRGLVTTMIILAVFCVCFLPYFLADAASSIIFFYYRTFVKVPGQQISGAAKDYIDNIQQYTFFLYDVLMLNSILDPVIYALRMREVRIGYRKLFRFSDRSGRRSSTGMSSHFGTSEGVGTTSATTVIDMNSSSVRRGTTVPDIANRNGRSPSSGSHHDVAYVKLTFKTNVTGMHDHLDVPHAERAQPDTNSREDPSTMSTTSVYIDKSSSALDISETKNNLTNT